MDYLVLIIAQMADEGNVVILGRGSQYILDDHPDAYHVLLIDGSKTGWNSSENYGLSQARPSPVASEDKRRRNLYQKFGKTDLTTPSFIIWC